MRTIFLRQSFIERCTPSAPGHSDNTALIALNTGKHLWQSPARLKTTKGIMESLFVCLLFGLFERSSYERVNDPLCRVFFSLLTYIYTMLLQICKRQDCQAGSHIGQDYRVSSNVRQIREAFAHLTCNKITNKLTRRYGVLHALKTPRFQSKVSHFVRKGL